jgi:hypothetical protein
MRTRTSHLGAAAVMVALLLSGCGGDGTPGPAARPAQRAAQTTSPRPADNGIASKPAKQILAATEAALRSARSVRIEFSGKDQDGPMRMSMVLTSGKDAAGWIEQAGIRAYVRAVDGGVYLRGRGMWEKVGGADAAKLIGDRWVRAPSQAAGEVTPLTKDLSIVALADEMFADESVPVFLRKQRLTAAGTPVVRLRAADGYLDVAATGKPYPLRADGLETGERMVFSQYDRRVSIKAPRDAIDFDKLRA